LNEASFRRLRRYASLLRCNTTAHFKGENR